MNTEQLNAFLDSIVEDPWNDSLRSMLADWLQEIGDPWGEFIVNDITSTSDKAAFVRDHGVRICQLFHPRLIFQSNGVTVSFGNRRIRFLRGMPEFLTTSYWYDGWEQYRDYFPVTTVSFACRPTCITHHDGTVSLQHPRRQMSRYRPHELEGYDVTIALLQRQFPGIVFI